MSLRNAFSILACVALLVASARGGDSLADIIYDPGELKPVDSRLKVKVGQRAPNFTLPAVNGGEISLKQFRGRKNVMISFVPAAFTPVCSAQWPGYSLVNDMFESHETVVLGITTDNIPSLHAWIQEMGGLNFDVLSDFHPHGETAKKYGVLRGDGTSERALFLVDKEGVIRWIDVHDINQRPPLEDLVKAMEDVSR